MRVTLILGFLCAAAYAAPTSQAAQRTRFLSPDAILRGRSELAVGPLFVADSALLPESFDARAAWPQCKSIGEIYDQGACGDCWAVSTVMTATDRWCIAHNQSQNPRLSVESMVGCCKVCGYGCADGFPNYAWSWLAGEKGSPYGVVTGGPLGNDQWCSAYSLPKCNHYQTKNVTLPSCESGPPDKTPACPVACDQHSSYKVPFAQDVHKFSKSYAVPADEQSIMNEIYSHGPVTAGFNVYSDWLHYPTGSPPSGVYKPAGGDEMGSHAVRMIGWGVSQGTKYWLIANSFGSKWGMDGYFKMARGVGAGGIEQAVVAGTV